MARLWAPALTAVLVAIGSIAVVAAGRAGDIVSGHGHAAAPAATSSSTRPRPRPKPVGPAAPVSFTIRGPAFHVTANVCSMPAVFPLDPPGEQHHTVCWVARGFGVAPSSDAPGTTYLLGHAWAEDADEVLNPLSIYAMNHVNLSRSSPASAVPGVSPPTVPIHRVAGTLAGYTITLSTAKGTLTYSVHDAFAVAKDHAGYVASVMNTRIRNRVVLITCGVHDGIDVDVNVIVTADLTSFRAA